MESHPNYCRRIGDIQPAKEAVSVVSGLSEHHKLCVASNGERGGVLKSLEVTSLNRFFPEHHVFTKIQVKRPKPAPDLFLFAAKKMGLDSNNCVVIEDSVAGVSAAVAANIKVIGYTGCAHNKKTQREMLKQAGAKTIIDELIHISDHI